MGYELSVDTESRTLISFSTDSSYPIQRNQFNTLRYYLTQQQFKLHHDVPPHHPSPRHPFSLLCLCAPTPKHPTTPLLLLLLHGPPRRNPIRTRPHRKSHPLHQTHTRPRRILRHGHLSILQSQRLRRLHLLFGGDHGHVPRGRRGGNEHHRRQCQVFEREAAEHRERFDFEESAGMGSVYEIYGEVWRGEWVGVHQGGVVDGSMEGWGVTK
mmetsp:Transcript_28281/g.56441  ORF Transcript_28281/g.56441 Transcript_28281/m.56441 type:complete len:212 (+) Transcript_28281:4-639(+)